jgi:hypothetical protein
MNVVNHLTRCSSDVSIRRGPCRCRSASRSVAGAVIMLAATVFAFITAVTSTVMENNTFKRLVAMSEMIVLAEVLSSYRTIL